MKMIVVMMMMKMMVATTVLVTQTCNQRLILSSILKHFTGHLVTGVCSAKDGQTVLSVRGVQVVLRSRRVNRVLVDQAPFGLMLFLGQRNKNG